MSRRDDGIQFKNQPRMCCSDDLVTILRYNPKTETVAFITATKKDYAKESVIGRVLFSFYEKHHRSNSALSFILTPLVMLAVKYIKQRSGTRYAAVKSMRFVAELHLNEVQFYNQGRRVDADGEWHHLFGVYAEGKWWELWLAPEEASKMSALVSNYSE